MNSLPPVNRPAKSLGSCFRELFERSVVRDCVVLETLDKLCCEADRAQLIALACDWTRVNQLELSVIDKETRIQALVVDAAVLQERLEAANDRIRCLEEDADRETVLGKALRFVEYVREFA